MTIHCLSTGAVRAKRGDRGVRRYLPGGWAEDTRPVNAFLVDHGDGLCLFDAGQTARAREPGYFPRWYPFFRLARFELAERDEAGQQLRRLGIDPADIRWVVLSHLHTDHVGGLDALRAAEVLVSRTEWQRATGLAGRLRGYLPQHWPHGIRPRAIDFTGPAVGPFSASLDLAGDGRLVLVPTPGHTPGHMALLAHAEERRFLLCGDLAHDSDELHRRQPRVAEFCRRHAIVPLAAHDPLAAAALGP